MEASTLPTTEGWYRLTPPAAVFDHESRVVAVAMIGGELCREMTDGRFGFVPIEKSDGRYDPLAAVSPADCLRLAVMIEILGPVADQQPGTTEGYVLYETTGGPGLPIPREEMVALINQYIAANPAFLTSAT